MSTWDMRKMYWKNSATMMVRRAKEENQKRLAPEVIKKINKGVAELAKDGERKPTEDDKLKDWQKDIME